VAVVSTGPYANHLHLTPDKKTVPAPHHSTFWQAGCSSRCPANSVKALKAVGYTYLKVCHKRTNSLDSCVCVYVISSWRTGSTRLIVWRKLCALLLSAWTKPFSFSSLLKSSTVTFSSWRKEMIRFGAFFSFPQSFIQWTVTECSCTVLLVFLMIHVTTYTKYANGQCYGNGNAAYLLLME